MTIDMLLFVSRPFVYLRKRLFLSKHLFKPHATVQWYCLILSYHMSTPICAKYKSFISCGLHSQLQVTVTRIHCLKLHQFKGKRQVEVLRPRVFLSDFECGWCIDPILKLQLSYNQCNLYYSLPRRPHAIYVIFLHKLIHILV